MAVEGNGIGLHEDPRVGVPISREELEHGGVPMPHKNKGMHTGTIGRKSFEHFRETMPGVSDVGRVSRILALGEEQGPQVSLESAMIEKVSAWEVVGLYKHHLVSHIKCSRKIEELMAHFRSCHGARLL